MLNIELNQMTSTKKKQLRIFSTVFLLLIFLPKITLFSISGLSSSFRVDLILSLIITSIFSYQFILRRSQRSYLPTEHPRTKRYSIGVVLLFIAAIISYYASISKSLSIVIGQVALYISLLSCFFFGKNISHQNSGEDFCKTLLSLLLFNILIHLIFSAFSLSSFTRSYTNSFGAEEVDYLFGLYGISSMPYQFSIYVIAFWFISEAYLSNKSLKFLVLLLSLLALATGDSRVALISFVILVVGLKKPHILFFIPLLAPLIQFNEKMQTIFSLGVDDFLRDPSIAMRVDNFYNYLDWLNTLKFVFGGGAQSFLEYSIQYGQPGPLDSLPLRLITEFGLVGLLILLFIAMRLLFIIFFVLKNNRLLLCAWFLFLGVYSLLNEGVIASRSGHIVFFVTGFLIYFPMQRINPISTKSYRDTPIITCAG